ncbi:putative bifunctional diguanylate cyclase/phosphodiesterase [Gilvimarinus sp. 1_MG-2023]|uniref:putative bifunctional diguanylate cyclase/phosphodiesterase n=1 Tax=Gilvimarinus sp. 1_MG-2023 TaxID=3062638 RepID=UPI0026E322FA|nr:EAL domain-containing protein [Gilvimarinus sp. 1_MG-2023]MDO6746068.1 EAL domain-containing protein [Gilvimarinus sp. 1_MG-2023]
MNQGIDNRRGVALRSNQAADQLSLTGVNWFWRFDRETTRLYLTDAEQLHSILFDPLPDLLSEEDYSAFCGTLAHFDRASPSDCFCTISLRQDLLHEDTQPQSLLFVFTPAGDINARIAEGVAIPIGRHAGNLGLSQYTLSVMELACDGLALFDANGTLSWLNTASRKLLGMNLRQQARAINRYNLLQDTHLTEQIALTDVLERVSSDKVGGAFVVRYPTRQGGGPLNFGQFRVRFIPLVSEESGGAFLMHLHLAGQHDSLANIDNLVLSDQTALTIKNQKGFYLSEFYPLYYACETDSGVSEVVRQTDLDCFSAHSAMALRRLGKESLAGQTALADIMTLALPPQSMEQRYTVLDLPLQIQGQKSGLYAQLLSPHSDQVLSTPKGHDVQRLLNAVRAAICYLDCWGVIKEVNQAARQVFGAQAFNDKHFVEYAQGWDDSSERQREIMHVARTGIAQTDSLESVTQHGRTRWYSVDKVPTRDDRGVISGVLLTMSEVTEQIEQAQNLRDIEARYKAYRANSTDAIWCYDMEPPIPLHWSVDEQAKAIANHARLSQCNDLLIKMMGLDNKQQVLGTDLSQIGSQNYFFDIHTFIRNHYQLGDHEITQKNKQGDATYRQISCVGVVDGGHLMRVWGTTKDITARKLYEEKLAYQANHDSLTKLPNRASLYKDLEQWLAARKPDQQGALLLIDLDRFKEINDTLGHQVGDQLLQQVGPRLKAELAEVPGTIARLGGDEFAIFLQRIRNSQQAIIIAHRTLDALRNEFNLEGFSTEISASIGVALAPSQAEDVSTLMRKADVAMYRAKKDMCGLSLYNAEYDPHSPKRLAMMSDLGRAIRENQLTLYYQPKVSLHNRQCYGVEALIRWFHPTMGLVSPAEFIPIVELTSLIHPLTNWVLDEAIKQARQWHDQGCHLTMAVNLSARNLLDDNLPSMLRRLLEHYRLPGSALDLEITESAIMTDPNRALRNLDELHALGVGLSVDDFGTGYSSLAYLKRLPIQTLKIDNSFVRQMQESERDGIIVKSTIQLAHNLEIKVVAEGVEDQELLDRLVAMGCDNAQGYFIGRPMNLDGIKHWIAESDWCHCLRSDS